MKYKYAEMIKARVDNMDLVLLVKTDGEWGDSSNDLPVSNGFDYFLCHPKHADTCLHCLNGGKAQLYSGDRFHDMPTYSGSEWSPDCVFMDADREIRIKPKKEKRWIVVSKTQCSAIGLLYNTCSSAYKFRSDAVDVKNRIPSNSSNLQIIEIEIEVN